MKCVQARRPKDCVLQSHRKQIVANRHNDSFRFKFPDSEFTVSFTRIFNIISEFIYL